MVAARAVVEREVGAKAVGAVGVRVAEVDDLVGQVGREQKVAVD